MRIVGTGAAKPDELCPDDFRLDMNLGLALVASALGANDAQARPAAVLATWSVAGEVEPWALGGSRRPEPSMFFAPGAPLPPPDVETARGPDSRWFKEVANPLRCVAQGTPGGGRPRAGAP